MAYPFFSGEMAGGDREHSNIDQTEEEVYHLLMSAYPGYTVETIKSELSWRQIERLMEVWKKHDPPNTHLRRIEEILTKVHNIKIIKNPVAKDQNLINELKGMGWL